MKRLKKIKQYIEKNSSFITVISTVLLSILTIFSSFCISSTQNRIQKEDSAPLFFLEKDKNDTIKIINKGGVISYFNFKRVTEIDISVNNKKATIEIGYYDENRLDQTISNMNNDSSWTYIPMIKDVKEEDIRTLVYDKIENIYPKEISAYINIKDYYVLSCKDYESSYRTFYYTIDKEGVVEPYNYEEKKQEKENVIFGSFISTYTYSKKDLYKILEQTIEQSLLRFRWYMEDSYVS